MLVAVVWCRDKKNDEVWMWPKCRQRCHDRISSEQREQIFSSFWQLGNLHLQRQFLINHVKITRKKTEVKGEKSLRYSLHVGSHDMQVCQTFFLHTLSISHQIVQTTVGKVTTNGHMVREQRKPPASRRLPEQVRKDVRSHINKFSTVPSHYCRHTSTRQYLPENLTLMEMYRMYESECQQQNITPAKRHISEFFIVTSIWLSISQKKPV